jgi:hypothetical protein
MSKFLPSAAAMLIGTLAMTHAYSESPELLNELGARLAEIRASSGDEVVRLASISDVATLRGISRDTIDSALGIPDSCDDNEIEQCVGQSSWIYWFSSTCRPVGAVGDPSYG